MAFPPNYRMERSGRDRKKAQKANAKQERRDEKAAQRKLGRNADEEAPGTSTPPPEEPK